MSWPGPVAPWEELELETVGGPETSSATSGLPWPWLLAILAAAAWFPLDSYWQSDDFIALHYALDFRHVLADFANPQYGATDIWWFYRPFITLSFWLDSQLTGASPFVPHLANALVHGLSAMLVGLIWARFLAPGAAWGAALLWGLAPGHAGSILWTAGRVDSYSTFWSLLSIWLLCLWIEGRRRARIGSLLAFLVALGCKELAFVVPGLALALCLGMSKPGARVRFALSCAWPYFLVLALYFVWRYYALGLLVGGYTGYSLDPGSALQGLGRAALYLVNPLMYSGGETQAQWLGGDLPSWFSWVGLLPALLALGVLAAHKRFNLLALALLVFLGTCVPMLPFWSASEDIKNLRQYYLPFAVLAGLMAAGGVGIWVLACLVWLTPLVEIRADYVAMHRELGAMHRQLILEAAETDPQMLFVAGLPRANAKGSALGFHFGVDRLLEPPFYSVAGARYQLNRLYTALEIPQEDQWFNAPHAQLVHCSFS